MGTDKALLKFKGETLAARGVRTLRIVCAEVAIAGGAPELRHLARVIPDGQPGCGPLGGIVAALEQSAYEWNLFLAVDMPFVPEAVLRELVSGVDGRHKIVLAEAEGRVQPLCGVYSRTALPGLRGELEAGRLKVKDAVAAAGEVAYVRFKHLDHFGNLNTPEEYAQASDASVGAGAFPEV